MHGKGGTYWRKLFNTNGELQAISLSLLTLTPRVNAMHGEMLTVNPHREIKLTCQMLIGAETTVCD